jgi:hypothetical protein
MHLAEIRANLRAKEPECSRRDEVLHQTYDPLVCQHAFEESLGPSRKDKFG